MTPSAADLLAPGERVRVEATGAVGRVSYASRHLVIVWFSLRDVDCFRPAEVEPASGPT